MIHTLTQKTPNFICCFTCLFFGLFLPSRFFVDFNSTLAFTFGLFVGWFVCSVLFYGLFKPDTLPLEADTWLTYQIDRQENGIAFGGGFLCNISGTGLTSLETSGSVSRSLQEAGPDEAIAFGLETLTGLFGSAIKRDFVKGHATAWRHEPFVRGSYSGCLPGGSGGRKILRRPHAERVFFAGEATHHGQQASASGAWLEGERAAAEIIASRL